MPYKDPERKRRWEREHREQRNARRRMQRLEVRSGQRTFPKPAPDPIPAEETKSSWKVIVGLAVGFGIALLAALGGINLPGPGSRGHVA